MLTKQFSWAKESPKVYHLLQEACSRMKQGKIPKQSEAKIHHYKVFQGLQVNTKPLTGTCMYMPVSPACAFLIPKVEDKCQLLATTALQWGQELG